MPNRKNLLRAAKISLGVTAVVVVFFGIRLALDPFQVKYWNRERQVDTSIDFFGQVVGASGKPLPKARIKVQIYSFRSLSLFFGDQFETRYIDCISDQEVVLR